MAATPGIAEDNNDQNGVLALTKTPIFGWKMLEARRL